jgi:hypothetical protein
MKISVIVKDPGKKPRHVHIENSLKNLQNTVGGYIETVTFASDGVVICNEEGRLLGLEPNCSFLGIDFVGTIVVAGVNGDELCDLPGTWSEWKRMFAELWEE